MKAGTLLRLSSPHESKVVLLSPSSRTKKTRVSGVLFCTMEMGGFEPPSENGYSYESTVRRFTFDLSPDP
jgi:hypothetical protein